MRRWSAISGITVSRALREERLLIKEVFRQCWLDTYPSNEYGVTADAINDRFNTCQPNGPDPRVMTLVARKDGKIMGVFCFSRLPDRNYLKAMYILPEYRHKGVGGILWEEAKKHLDPRLTSYLEVAVYNVRAIALYRKLGFVETGNEAPAFQVKDGVMIPQIEMRLDPQSS